ncbi:hypothetical protein A5712_29850 [Mycobacterium sp. E2327]|nr:hypothetical protein A5712_29850 [Mycobacterium sp. E2327]
MNNVARVAAAHELSLAEVIQDLGKYYRYAQQEGRGTTVSFAPNGGDAEHAWAQRAPEVEWESLWAVYRIKYMKLDDPWYWNTDVAGHAWVWDQMRHDQLAVISYTTSYAEMVDLGARGGGFGESQLPPLELLNSPTTHLPEIVYDVPFKPDGDRLTVTPVARHLPWNVFAYKLGLSPDEFERRADNGEFGPPASEGVSCPRIGNMVRPWWTSDHPALESAV